MTTKTTPPKPAKRRSPGRPTTDSPDLRARLIEAALACFVRDGIAATSLRSIAKEAGVTPAMLNYYFGSQHGDDANLDVDDTTSYGPETITLEKKHYGVCNAGVTFQTTW